MSRPRLGFLGTGWIGRHRMEAMIASGGIKTVAVGDPSPDCASAAAALAPGAEIVPSLEAMLEHGLDGVVIATPSALHAAQAIAALQAGVAVFCQKPLGRDAGEVAAVIAAARSANRLLGCDFSYRHTAGVQAIAPLLSANQLGRVHAADLVFHNAYGPDKPWFYDRAQSGGGCVIDLGVHLVDLALWLLGWPEVREVRSRLFAGGEPLRAPVEQVEDFALAELELAGGAVVRLACSWRLHAGQEAVIEASFYGTHGGARLRNVGGSFYDFEALRLDGTGARVLASPPDAWGGRAAVAWAEQLATVRGFNPAAERFATVAAVLDRIYAAA
jgi:predicted dehydrogenase